MNISKRLRNSASVWRIAIVLSLLLMFVGCEKHHEALAASDEYYTCSMDPQVIENAPGICPICHMKLIAVKKNELRTGQIKLSEQQIKLAHIIVDTLKLSDLTMTISLAGTVVPDQTGIDAISARVAGRIDKLYIKNSGEYVHKGQVLFEIYSETLNSAQSEYLLISQKSASASNASSFLELASAIRRKLLAYGMTSEQLDQIVKSKHIIDHIPFEAKREAFVQDIYVTEGSYVTEGLMMFHLAVPDLLWVEAQVYLPYIPFVHLGSDARISLPAILDKVFSGKVIFIEPQVRSNDRYILTRFQISNPNMLIRPGMNASVEIQTSSVRTLSLPLDAVIQERSGASVWVRLPTGNFEIRMVKTGLQNTHAIEITEGLQSGDFVVTSGTYLLNSEYVFKRGASPMAGHNMQDMDGLKSGPGSMKASQSETSSQPMQMPDTKTQTQQKNQETVQTAKSNVKVEQKKKGADLYQCPMHPEVQSAHPGICPNCGMDLEKVESK